MPAGITALVVILWIQALLGVVFGAFLIIEHNTPALAASASESSAALLNYGIATLIIGLLTFPLALSLTGGSKLARWLIALVSLLHFSAALYVLVSMSGLTIASAITDGLMTVAVLYVLFGSEQSRQFFGETAT